jgi:uncharacterized protein (TIGR04222 family)
MFPFNLPGPQFLFFYFVLTIAVFVIIRTLQERREREWHLPTLDAADPYRIACLNHGPQGAMQVATMSLIDRDIISVTNDTFTTQSGSVDVRRPIEKELVKLFAKGDDAEAIERAATYSPACKAYEAELVKLRLIAGAEVRATRWPAVLIGMGLLAGVAVTKIAVAIAAGRTNIWFLVILAVLALVILLALVYKRGTGLGSRFMETQRALFKGLPKRSANLKRGGNSADLAILAAVFGLAAVPATAFPFVDHLAVKRSGDSSSDSGSGSDSSGDSGCGGGGGGCGGCGS